MDIQQRTQVILAAVNAAGTAGDPGWMQRVTDLSKQILLMLRPESRINKSLDILESCKVFTGSVLSVRREVSSTRGIVTVFTGTTKADLKDAITKQPLPTGCEQIRTERTDDESGLAMARMARELIGHRVVLFVELEPVAGSTDRKVRVLRHIEAIGLADDEMAKEAKAAKDAKDAA